MHRIIRVAAACSVLVMMTALPHPTVAGRVSKNPVVSASPEVSASRIVNRRIVLKKNKFYKGERPR